MNVEQVSVWFVSLSAFLSPLYISLPGCKLLPELVAGGRGHGDPGDVHRGGVHDGGQDVGGRRPLVLDQRLHGGDDGVSLAAQRLAVPVHQVLDLGEILALKILGKSFII